MTSPLDRPVLIAFDLITLCLKLPRKKTKVKIYSPCPGCLSFPPCDWCCLPCSCWRCCWSRPGRSCRRPARRSPSLSASCLSNMRCTGDRSCRIAHVPETGVRLAFCLNKPRRGYLFGKLLRCSLQWE